MPGRGRGAATTTTSLRKPGAIAVKEDPQKSLAKVTTSKIVSISPSEDLKIQSLAAEIKSIIKDEKDLVEMVDELCESSLSNRGVASTVGLLSGHLAHFQIGETKFRNLLLKKVQKVYSEKDSLEVSDRYKFVTSGIFLTEIFYNLKSENGTHFKVLADPVLSYLSMILRPHLASEPPSSIHEEILAVAKLLQTNSSLLQNFEPKKFEDVVGILTEIMIIHPLNEVCRLNLLTFLSQVWSSEQSSIDPASTYSTLATKLGLSLSI